MTINGISWETWEPVYTTILADFGFDRLEDERARDELAELLAKEVDPELPDATGKSVAIAGAGPSLAAELDRLDQVDLVIAASDAARLIREAGEALDVHVTDLDEENLSPISHSHAGIPVVVHAHGDNRTQLANIVPQLNRAAVLGTTQAEPLAGISNPGGFTDGDRAAFLAHALGAERLRFVGWDFDDSTVSAQKRRKLWWARQLLAWLEQLRDEQFSVLDGHRDAIDLTDLRAS